MKANRIIIALVMLMAGMSSCQDWFDVSPKADVKAEDIAEIKRLLNEEHIYLMKNEAGIESENLL